MRPTASTRWFFLVSPLVCLVALWFVSGLLRTGGICIFAAGALMLAGCLVLARHGQRQPLFSFYLATTMSAAAIGCVECALRFVPSVLNGSVANAAYGRYHTLPGGIFDRDVHLGFAHKPNFSCEMYWNGHWWRHETNAVGYRGRAVDQADAVFLGDSMIYGHGVEDVQTVSSRFGASTGRTVANLGQSSTCLIQMEMLYRRIGIGLRPKVVFVCSHYNDIGDAAAWYPEDELERLAAASAHEPYEPLARRHYWPKPRWRADYYLWDDCLAPSLRISGAIKGWTQALRDRSPRTREPSVVEGGRSYVPPADVMGQPFAPWDPAASASDRLGWKAHCRSLAAIDFVCREQGAKLVLLDIGYPQAFSQAIEDLAAKMGAAYSPAGRVALRRALAGEDIYLANDAHWSPLGCTVIAEELAKLKLE
jgi:hypothetical protein